MMPTFQRTGSAERAWQMGLIACLGSGIIELAGAFIAERVRRHTPRAALLATLAGIAVGFISMTFAAAPETGLVFRAYGIGIGYLLFAATFAAVGRWHTRTEGAEPSNELQP